MAAADAIAFNTGDCNVDGGRFDSPAVGLIIASEDAEEVLARFRPLALRARLIIHG